MQHLATSPRVGISYRRHGSDAVECIADGHVTTFANTVARESWLAAQHPRTYQREQRQRDEIALVNGNGLV